MTGEAGGVLLHGEQALGILPPDEAVRPATIDSRMLSELISTIYDCAIAPGNWEQALRSICRVGNFCCATINLQDRENKLILIQKSTGASASWIEQYHANRAQYGAEIRNIRSRYCDTLSVDEPKVWSRHIPREVYARTRLFNEWLHPQGIIDVMQLPIMRQSDRYGAISFGRHEEAGPIGESEMALVSLLQPHLRRALTMSSMLEVRALRANSLRSVIENLSTGILFLEEDGTIIEANPAARRLIERCPEACVVDGRLSSRDREQVELLRLSLISAAAGKATIINAPIICGSMAGQILSFYILPLADGSLRPNLRKAAVAAIFITSDDGQQVQLSRSAVLGVVYDLTMAEKRVAEAMADGKTSLQAAKLLGVSEATIRSHLTRIFAKTGVTRQAGLISLMHRLTLPLRSDDRIRQD